MSRATADDQLRFLLSCIRHSNYGRIDFAEVANECSIVSKGAAAKRYERLLKSVDVLSDRGGQSFTPCPKVKSKANIAKAAAEKRHKVEGISYNAELDNGDDDCEDIKPTITKLEPQDTISVKSEHLDIQMVQSTNPSLQSPSSHSSYGRTLLQQQSCQYDAEGSWTMQHGYVGASLFQPRNHDLEMPPAIIERLKRPTPESLSTPGQVLASAPSSVAYHGLHYISSSSIEPDLRRTAAKGYIELSD